MKNMYRIWSPKMQKIGTKRTFNSKIWCTKVVKTRFMSTISHFYIQNCVAFLCQMKKNIYLRAEYQHKIGCVVAAKTEVRTRLG